MAEVGTNAHKLPFSHVRRDFSSDVQTVRGTKLALVVSTPYHETGVETGSVRICRAIAKIKQWPK